MTSEDLIERKQKIQAAFERLLISPKGRESLPEAICSLTTIDTSGPGTTPKKFLANERKCSAQLARLERLSNQLAKYIDTELHESAILALCGWNVRLPLVRQLRHTASCAGLALKAQEKRPDLLKGFDSASRLPGGQPKNVRAFAVTQLTAYHFRRLTGKRATLTYDASTDPSRVTGRFFELLKAIFIALPLEQDPEHYAREVLGYRQASPKKGNATKK